MTKNIATKNNGAKIPAHAVSGLQSSLTCTAAR